MINKEKQKSALLDYTVDHHDERDTKNTIGIYSSSSDLYIPGIE